MATAEDQQRLRRWIGCLGAINLFCLSIHAVLSYGLATAAPFGRDEPLERASFARLAEALSFLGDGVRAFVSGESLLRSDPWFSVAYIVPLAGSTAVFVALLALLRRNEHDLDAGVPHTLFGWAAAFAVPSFFACPVLVQDFWLSIAWGRMVVSGPSPYYADLTATITAGLPLDDFKLRMTYGPLWAIICGLVAWLSDRSVLLEAISFKVFLTAAWLAALRLVAVMLRGQTLPQQCFGFAVFAWIPLSVRESVADGHNDIVMVLAMLLWLYGLQRQKQLGASMAVIGSVLIKYVTAPLWLLDILHWRYAAKRPLRAYVPRAIAMGAISVITFAAFMRSPAFFEPVISMAKWRVFTPADAVFQLGKFIQDALWSAAAVRMPFVLLGLGVLFLFPWLALRAAWRFTAQPNDQALNAAALAAMSAMVFSVVGHVWPWFLLWVLPLAALAVGSAMARWVVSVTLVSPFASFVLFAFLKPRRYFIPTLLLYGCATLLFALASRSRSK